MCVPLKELIQQLQGLWSEGSPTFAFLGRLRANELREVLHAVLVSLLGFRHPALQHGFDLLGALWGDVQLLKPGTHTQILL